MAKLGMRHRENFNELVGHLERDAVKLSLPNRMALLALNNKVFANGMEAHLDAQQHAQAPHQQVYIPPPPTGPMMQTGTSAAAPAVGPPSWMATAGGLSVGAAKLGAAGLGGLAHASMAGIGGLANASIAGIASANMLYQHHQAQQAAQTAIQDDDWASVGGYSDHMSIGDDAHALQMQIHAQHMADAAAVQERAAQELFKQTHQTNPFADGGGTLALMSTDTSSALAITQFAMESQRPAYPHDGSDLLNQSSPSSQWVQPTSTTLVPQFTTLESQSQDLGDGRGRHRSRSAGKSKRRRDPATDDTDYGNIADVPGNTTEEKMDYLKAQEKYGKGQQRRHTPYALTSGASSSGTNAAQRQAIATGAATGAATSMFPGIFGPPRALGP